MREFQFSTVQAHLNAYLGTLTDADWPLKAYELPRRIAEHAGLAAEYSEGWNSYRGSWQHRSVRRFEGQVTRAADQLGPDTLIKVGRGQISPAGRYMSNESEYWSPEAYAQATIRREQDEQEHTAMVARADGVRAQLAAAGYRPGMSLKSGVITLPLEDLEQLTALVAEHAGGRCCCKNCPWQGDHG